MSNVVEIGNFAIHRKTKGWLPRKDECQHEHLSFAEVGEFIDCDDCGKQVSAWWVLTRMCESWDKAKSKLDAEREKFSADKAESLHLIAAKMVERAWRSRTSVPVCPHCRRGILPGDRLGSSTTSREMELKRRQADLMRSKP